MVPCVLQVAVASVADVALPVDKSAEPALTGMAAAAKARAQREARVQLDLDPVEDQKNMADKEFEIYDAAAKEEANTDVSTRVQESVDSFSTTSGCHPSRI